MIESLRTIGGTSGGVVVARQCARRGWGVGAGKAAGGEHPRGLVRWCRRSGRVRLVAGVTPPAVGRTHPAGHRVRRAKRSFASASSKGRSRRRAVCSVGAGSDMRVVFSPGIGGRSTRHLMPATRNGLSRRRAERRARSSALIERHRNTQITYGTRGRRARAASHPGFQHVDLAAWRGRVEAVFYQPADRQQASQ
jgi:hypothetical protein